MRNNILDKFRDKEISISRFTGVTSHTIYTLWCSSTFDSFEWRSRYKYLPALFSGF